MKKQAQHNNAVNYQDFLVDESTHKDAQDLHKRSIREMFENEVFAGSKGQDASGLCIS